MRSLDYRTRVFILSSVIVVLLIAAGISILYFFKNNPRRDEVPVPEPAPIAQPTPEELKPVVPPPLVVENQSPKNENEQPVAPSVSTSAKKTPVSGPE